MACFVLLLIGVVVFIFAGSLCGIFAYSQTRKSPRQSISTLSADINNKRMDIIFMRLNAIEQKLGMTVGASQEKPVNLQAAPPQTPPPPPPPAKQNPPSTQAVEKLDTLINRAAVHEQTQPPAVPREAIFDKWANFEALAGRTWLSWAGIIVFFVSVGFFLKHAFENNWITPAAQIISACAVGVIMFAAGLFYARGKYVQFGRSMMGGGLMVLYAALYCAYSPYVYETPVIPESSIVFALMCVVTAMGVIAAVWLDTQVISVLAMIGGFLTPVLISTGVDQRDVLFSYLLVLDAGILTVSIFRKWRLMDTIGFVATALLFVLWYDKFYTSAAKVPTLAWLGVFYLVFLALPFMYHLIHKTSITVERFVLSNANAALSFIMAWIILDPDKNTLSWIALGLAGVYALLVFIANARIPQDSLCRFAFVIASFTFAVMFVPLQFTGDVITLIWAAMACGSLGLAIKYRYTPIQAASFVILLITILRTVSISLDLPAPLNGELIFLNQSFATPLFICVAGFAFGLLIKLGCDEENPLQSIKIAVCVISGLLLAYLTGLEIQRFITAWQMKTPEYFDSCQWLVMWSLAAIGFSAGEWRAGNFALRIGSIIVAVFAFVMLTDINLAETWKTQYPFLSFKFFASIFCVAGYYFIAGSLKDENGRFTGFIFVNLLLLALLNIELGRWLGWNSKQYWPIISLNAGVALVSLLYTFLFRKNASLVLSLSAVGLGITISYFCYAGYPYGYQPRLALNGRFISALAICVEGFAAGYLLRRARIKDGASFVSWLFTIVVLGLLSAEAYLWFDHNIADAQKAQYISLLSVTVVWTLYAAAMLIFGFASNNRPVRLAALGLLAATALKLVLLDMSNVRQGYRIASFMVLGVVMIAASYIYNRAEKFMFQNASSEKKPELF